MIRFEIGNQICVCLSENEISLELNQSLHHSIPVNPNEYAILSTIAKYGSLNTPISQRLIESKITQQYKMTLPENGFKNAVAALRRKFRKLTEEHVTTKKYYRKYSPDRILHPFYYAKQPSEWHRPSTQDQSIHNKQPWQSPSYLSA